MDSLAGMELVHSSICGGYWSLRAVNLFMPPLDKLCLNSIPERNLNISKKAYYFPKMLPRPPRMLPRPPMLLLLPLDDMPPKIMPNMLSKPAALVPLFC